jgi:hypothetical protein
MHRLYLVRPVAAPPRPEERSAKVIALRVRREARNDPRPPAPEPNRRRAA